jgi:hypothetical protein
VVRVIMVRILKTLRNFDRVDTDVEKGNRAFPYFIPILFSVESSSVGSYTNRMQLTTNKAFPENMNTPECLFI